MKAKIRPQRTKPLKTEDKANKARVALHSVAVSTLDWVGDVTVTKKIGSQQSAFSPSLSSGKSNSSSFLSLFLPSKSSHGNMTGFVKHKKASSTQHGHEN